jgi:hypothetical protein
MSGWGHSRRFGFGDMSGQPPTPDVALIAQIDAKGPEPEEPPQEVSTQPPTAAFRGPAG